MIFILYLSSGFFLGWTLGANDASNVFGTAVGSRMIKFRTAAICCSIFIILGAVFGGDGTSSTLAMLGAVDELAGAFTVALAAGLSVYLMTKAGYPVSTSQAVVGAIIGWNIFSGKPTDFSVLSKIVAAWVASPLMAAVLAIVLYWLLAFGFKHLRMHILRMDFTMRCGLLLVGALGSYSLGANNIANVMGVFVPVVPFADIHFAQIFRLSPAQQLFILGSLSIAAGVMTYSRSVMLTVGEGITKLSPVAAFVVVLSHSLVLILFTSKGLQAFLTGHHLPALPLVPLSSSQAIVGAVIGIGLLNGGHGVRWGVIRGIACGWLVTPLIAALVCYISLFILQNVFEQNIYRPDKHSLSQRVLTAAQVQKIKLKSKYLQQRPIDEMNPP